MNYQTKHLLADIKGELCVLKAELRVKIYFMFHRKKRWTYRILCDLDNARYETRKMLRAKGLDTSEELEAYERGVERFKRRLPDFVLEYMGLL